MKYGARIAVMVLAGSLSMTCAASDLNRGFDGVAGTGSLASLYFWANECAYRGVMNPGHAFRLLVDGLGVVTALKGNKDLGCWGITANIACCVGSLFSLVVWAPAIWANLNNPLYFGRAVIDCTQIVVTTRRMKDYKKS